MISDERTMQDACQEFGHLHNLRHSKLVVSYGACVEVESISWFPSSYAIIIQSLHPKSMSVLFTACITLKKFILCNSL